VGQVLVADADHRFTVELSEATGTGYRWTVAALPPGITLEGDAVAPAGSALGSTRKRVFRFAAASSGQYQIDFELQRPWEGQAVQSRSVQVRVAP